VEGLFLFEIKNLGKKYVSGAGDKWALRNVNISLPSRGLIAIKGESGSGKSTLLNLLATFEEPTEGSIFFNGVDLKNIRGSERENLRNFRFGFLYQHFNLLEDLTSLENVILPLQIRGVKLATAKIKAEALFQEFGMNDLKGKKCSLLSGGEKQRVALLRAIVGEPSVIFADEPTGALDHNNETLVMDALKKLAKKNLVILVSHNEKMIQNYAERTLTLSDGKLISDTNPEDSSPHLDFSKPTRGRRADWKKWILRGHFEKNLGKNLLSFVSGVVGYVSLLISASFVHGSQESLDLEKKKTLLYYQASLSEKISYPIPGSPLKLSKNERPTLDTAKIIFSDYPYLSIENDYSYFLPGYSAATLDGESIDPISFSPIFDTTLNELGNDLVVDGKAPELNDFYSCLINKEMADSFSFSLVGKTISLQRDISVNKFDTNDTLHLSFSFKVMGVVKEFSFLNAPRVYFSYPAERDYFTALSLPNISKVAERQYKVSDLLDESLGDETYASYSFLCFAHNEEEANGLRLAQDRLASSGSTCTISNSSYDIAQGFSSLRKAISGSLVPFLVIEALSVAFIVGSLAYSTFIEHRKEAAILMTLGARKNEVASLYLVENIFVSLFSATMALGLLWPLEKIINPILSKQTGLSNLLSLPLLKLYGIPFLPIVALFLVAILISGSRRGSPVISRQSESRWQKASGTNERHLSLPLIETPWSAGHFL
jgi:ABC-type lipoprotein export system ATPase subunit